MTTTPRFDLPELQRQWLPPRDVVAVAGLAGQGDKGHFRKTLLSWADAGYFKPLKSGPRKTHDRLFSAVDAIRARVMYDLVLFCGLLPRMADALSRELMKRFEAIVAEEEDYEDHFESAEYVAIFSFVPANPGVHDKGIEWALLTRDEYTDLAGRDRLPAHHVRAAVGETVYRALVLYRDVWRDEYEKPPTVEELDRLYPHRGCDEFGNPRDPEHPWNRKPKVPPRGGTSP